MKNRSVSLCYEHEKPGLKGSVMPTKISSFGANGTTSVLKTYKMKNEFPHIWYDVASLRFDDRSSRLPI